MQILCFYEFNDTSDYELFLKIQDIICMNLENNIFEFYEGRNEKKLRIEYRQKIKFLPSSLYHFNKGKIGKK